MGSTASKFKKYLHRGDEFAAMQIYQNSPDLRKTLNPNVSYGDNHQHNTPLHYAAKHGMKHLLRTFLHDLGGNPNKRNANNENVLHCACQPSAATSGQERRAACVQLLIYWKGAALPLGGYERTDLEAQDSAGNTALHWAAHSGLRRCVELLVTHGAPLFVENRDKMTPCDMAMRASRHEIAQFLESRMVFADHTDVVNEDDLLDSNVQCSSAGGTAVDDDCAEDLYSGLRNQDLQEAKDQLLVDTSDMLKVPLFTAEALLRNNEWSKQHLLEKWMRDAAECCREAGVPSPASILQRNGGGSLDSSGCADVNAAEDTSEFTCEICLCLLGGWERPVRMSCKHSFCRSCWSSYLTTKIQDGDTHHILCPAFKCDILVPIDIIEKLVSPEIARRYLQFDIKAFVESNKSIKWCPIADCGRAVCLPQIEQTRLPTTVPRYPPPVGGSISHAVDCGNSHFFCWECLELAHTPCSCKQWRDWQMKIAEIKPEELSTNHCNGTADAASCLWLVTNSKPCPNCKCPIQKNEGCNHIKCSKCKFDFCWVCQETWKKHSSATGGYFRCNRFEAVHKADEKQDNLISEAMDRNNQMQELSRFLHYYTRFRNHENSARLEQPLLANVRAKMQALAKSLGLKYHPDTIQKTTNFIEDGVNELLKARRVLCGSYIYGFYLPDDGYSRAIFEFMQNELEVVTEKLSEMIARPYLRTPKSIIIQTSILVRKKRYEFVRAVTQGLIPPDASLGQKIKKKRKRFYDEVVSLNRTELTPSTSWLEWSCTTGNNANNNKKTSANGGDSDYNVQLLIALEMSRLQVLEECMNKKSSSVATTTDDQLKLAIELSLNECHTQINHKNGTECYSNNTIGQGKSVADTTVDHFLKSIANGSINLSTVESSTSGTNTVECRSRCPEGTFKISDLHEHGFDVDCYTPQTGNTHTLKRSHSTGDLYATHRCPARLLRRQDEIEEELRYHLDSDHSMQHDDKPEDLTRRLTKTLQHRRRKLMLLHHYCASPVGTGGGSSIPENSSLDDAATISDAEVYGILSSISVEEDSVDSGRSNRRVPMTATNRTSVCRSEVSSPTLKKTVSFSKSTESLITPDTKLGISIRVQEWHKRSSSTLSSRRLETDSSNEYESETGIPKSPTLYISGVSISRSPEMSPTTAATNCTSTTTRPFRSSSLSVPPPLSATSGTQQQAPVTARSCNNSPLLNVPLTDDVFVFPKSSTEGALSSVLHIHESNMDSDDFHEALFLPSVNLNTTSTKRCRKRSTSTKRKDSTSATPAATCDDVI